MTLSIPDQILAWSAGRPLWQRDALRRLFEVGSLSKQDMAALTALCRSDAGLDAPGGSPSALPLKAEHISGSVAGSAAVSLTAVGKVEHINALESGLTLSFASSGLTVVYGDNGAGKSGYARILKHACRARGVTGTVLSDVFDETAGQPSAEISFVQGQQDELFKWSRTAKRPEGLRDIGVFDSASATVYVDEQTDVAFRPFGLDVFPKLVRACDELRGVLQAELMGLGADRAFSDLLGENPVGNAIRGIDKADAEVVLTALGTLSHDEEARLAALRSQVAALDVDAPGRRAAEGKLRHARFTSLLARLDTIDGALGTAARDALSAMLQRLSLATEIASNARAAAAGYATEWQIGSAAWQELWHAAKRYSELVRQSAEPFFSPDADTACALCKQSLPEEARQRLVSFSEFASHEALQKEATAAAEVEEAVTALRTLAISSEDDITLLAEVSAISSETADVVRAFLEHAARLRDELVEAVSAGSGFPSDELQLGAREALRQVTASVADEVSALEAASEPEAARAVREEFGALSAREKLRHQLAEVIAERTRRAHRKALKKALKQVETAAITSKNTDLTKAGISDQLRRRFQNELDRLALRHLTVSVEPQQGTKGVTYHQIRFTNAKSEGWSASDVLSEGEQRCVALAGFLAELSTQPTKSGVVFDDPVSSLDHERRSVVAARIVEEAQSRQVIVFTHDIVFLLFLEEECVRTGTPWKASYLSQRGTKRGVPVDGLPWYGQTLTKRIGWLRQQHQQLTAAAKTLEKEALELQTAMLWGRLREAWECGVEEVLLGGAVKRFSRKVQTQQLKKIADISDADIAAVEAGMTIASIWMPGHDLSGAINQPMPPLDTLKSEIDKLEVWRAGIVSRRK